MKFLETNFPVTTVRSLLLTPLPILLIIVLMGAGSEQANAVPRFTLLSGSRCSNCHFNPQGSGIRNEFGWLSINEVGALGLDKIGLGSLKTESNAYLNGKLTFGMDARVQYVKIGRPPFASQEFFPMQLAAHAAVVPFKNFAAYGSYNFSESKYSYPGQSPWTAALQYQPGIRLPSIRVGHIQPSVGIRHDDHTFFIRREAARTTSPVLPPDYDEYGAELTYEGMHWLTVNGGVFDATNLAMSDPTVDSSSLSWSARVALWPQLFNPHINGVVGGSVLANGDYRMLNVFGGFGLADQSITLYAEALLADNASDRKIRNISLQTSWQPKEWVALEGRYEIGNTDLPPGSSFSSSAIVIGAEFFPIPFLEIRPEYRYYKNDDYSLGQFTFQLHAFY